MTQSTDNKPWTSWYDGKRFTADWTSRAFPTWIEHLSDLRVEKLKILEIGAWEGKASIFFLNFFPRSHLTCLDIFTLGNEGFFDSNVMSSYADRVTKVKGRSTSALDSMSVSDQQFDLIYVDGSHNRDDVMIDSIASWRVLRVGGTIIWDDYAILSAMPGSFISDQDPKPAIDTFLDWHKDELEVLHSDYQVIAKKTKAHYVDPAIIAP